MRNYYVNQVVRHIIHRLEVETQHYLPGRQPRWTLLRAIARRIARRQWLDERRSRADAYAWVEKIQRKRKQVYGKPHFGIAWVEPTKLPTGMKRPLNYRGLQKKETGEALTPFDYRWLDNDYGPGFQVFIDHQLVPKSAIARACEICDSALYFDTYECFVDPKADDYGLPEAILEAGRIYHYALRKCEACRPNPSLSNQVVREIAKHLWSRGIDTVRGKASAYPDGVKEVAWFDLYRRPFSLPYAPKGLRMTLDAAREPDGRKPYDDADRYERPDMDALGLLRDHTTKAVVDEYYPKIEFDTPEKKDPGADYLEVEAHVRSDGVHRADRAMGDRLLSEARALEIATIRDNEADDSKETSDFLRRNGVLK